MTKKNETPSDDDEPMYSIPASAHQKLFVLREQLLLLGTLIEPRTRAEEGEDRSVPPAAVALGFGLLASQLGEVLEAVR